MNTFSLSSSECNNLNDLIAKHNWQLQPCYKSGKFVLLHSSKMSNQQIQRIFFQLNYSNWYPRVKSKQDSNGNKIKFVPIENLSISFKKNYGIEGIKVKEEIEKLLDLKTVYVGNDLILLNSQSLDRKSIEAKLSSIKGSWLPHVQPRLSESSNIHLSLTSKPKTPTEIEQQQFHFKKKLLRANLPNKLIESCSKITQYLNAHQLKLSSYKDLKFVVRGKINRQEIQEIFLQLNYPGHYLRVKRKEDDEGNTIVKLASTGQPSRLYQKQCAEEGIRIKKEIEDRLGVTTVFLRNRLVLLNSQKLNWDSLKEQLPPSLFSKWTPCEQPRTSEFSNISLKMISTLDYQKFQLMNKLGISFTGKTSLCLAHKVSVPPRQQAEITTFIPVDFPDEKNYLTTLEDYILLSEQHIHKYDLITVSHLDLTLSRTNASFRTLSKLIHKDGKVVIFFLDSWSAIRNNAEQYFDQIESHNVSSEMVMLICSEPKHFNEKN